MINFDVQKNASIYDYLEILDSHTTKKSMER